MKMMSAGISASRLQRAEGRAEIAFKRRGPATVLDRLHQQGCAKIRLPKVHDMGCPEAVLLNTSGGLTGGDVFETVCHWAENTTAAITTQAAERVYKSLAGKASVSNRLSVSAGASAFWLPQETILFDGSAIERSFEAELAPTARLIAVESWMAGRHAMGEEVRQGYVRDHWRIRQDGKLIFADCLRLDGDIHSLLGRPAIAGSNACFATVIVVSADVQELCSRLRPALACSVLDQVLIARLLAKDAASLRQKLCAIISQMNEFLPVSSLRVPKVWHI